MKGGWPIKPLGEVVEYQRGLTYAKGDEVEASNNVVLRATNIDLNTNLLDLAELRYISDRVAVPAGKRVRKGSLLICTASGSKSHLGKVAYIDEDYGYAFGGFMGMLTPKTGVLPRYLFRLMTSGEYKDFIRALSDGANINNLKFDDLARFSVPLPPLAEQERIVGILDEAFAAIATAKANAEKNLRNARAVFESEREAVLSDRKSNWTATTIGDEVDLLSGFPFKSSGYTEDPKDVRLLRGDNVIQGRLRWDDVMRWPTRDMAPYARYQLAKGDVVLAMDRPWVKAGLKYAQVGASDLPCLLVQRTSRLRSGTALDQNYLKHLLGTMAFSRHLLGVQTGIGVPHISGQQIKDFRFSCPPLAQQRTLVARLDQLDGGTQRLESLAQRKLAALDALKASLLDHAFSGRLNSSTITPRIAADAQAAPTLNGCSIGDRAGHWGRMMVRSRER